MTTESSPNNHRLRAASRLVGFAALASGFAMGWAMTSRAGIGGASALTFLVVAVFFRLHDVRRPRSAGAEWVALALTSAASGAVILFLSRTIGSSVLRPWAAFLGLIQFAVLAWGFGPLWLRRSNEVLTIVGTPQNRRRALSAFRSWRFRPYARAQIGGSPAGDASGGSPFVIARGPAFPPGLVAIDPGTYVKLASLELPNGEVLMPREAPAAGLSGKVKRSMDLLLALPLVCLAAPFVLVTALVVLIFERHVPFYSQIRITANGRPFRILKVRSMRPDAEPNDRPVWPTLTDRRMTPIGRFLRKAYLDELPQLLNVVAGSMSLVGPRPERPEFAQVFASSLPKYKLRHRVPGGLTGWAQVQGYAGNTSIRRRLYCDIQYVDSWNPAFDICIIIMTLLRVVLRRERRVVDFVPGHDRQIP